MRAIFFASSLLVLRILWMTIAQIERRFAGQLQEIFASGVVSARARNVSQVAKPTPAADGGIAILPKFLRAGRAAAGRFCNKHDEKSVRERPLQGKLISSRFFMQQQCVRERIDSFHRPRNGSATIKSGILRIRSVTLAILPQPSHRSARQEILA